MSKAGEVLKIINEVKKDPELQSSDPKNANRALKAFHKLNPTVDKGFKAKVVFEHGHLWIVHPNGGQWDVVDADGPGTIDGFSFEQVSEPEDF